MCYTLGTSNSFIMGLKGSPQIQFLSLYKSVFEEHKVISGGSFMFLLERCNETSLVHCLFLFHSKVIFVFLDV